MLLHGDALWNKGKPRLLPYLLKGGLEEVNVNAESDQQSVLELHAFGEGVDFM